MARTSQRKRRRKTRDSSAKSGSSSESDWVSEDECDQAEKEERRWQGRRSAQDNKGKGKELVKEEDEESGSSESEEDAEMEVAEQQRKDMPEPFDEICGICLSEGGNERGKLDCCDHFFCFGCIMEWAKVESRCPMCKQRFLTVTRPSMSGVSRSRNRSVRIPTRDQMQQVYEPSEEEIRLFTDPYQNTVCTECQEAGDEGLLLLCDRCDAAAHTYCVGLGRSVPRGDWFCQVCQTLECESSGEDDDEDISFDTADLEEGDSGTESILALLVADVQPNLFAGRTRHSSAQGSMPLRRSTRRRIRRTSNTDSHSLPEAYISMSGHRRGFFPALMDSYGVARTLFRQRQVHATVHNRLQNMRENWNRFRSGEEQFSSARQSVTNSRPDTESGSLPSSSQAGIMTRSTLVTSVEDGGFPTTSQTRGVGRSAEEVDIDRAWTMMDQARRLEGSSGRTSQPVATGRGGSAHERASREVKLQEPLVSARTRQVQGETYPRTNCSRGGPDERHSQGDVHSRANSSRGTLDERHLQGNGHSKPNSGRGGLEVFLHTRSNSRDADTMDCDIPDISAKEEKPPGSSHMESLLNGGENSRGGYNLRDSNHSHGSRTVSNSAASGGSIRNSTLRESRNDSGILHGRSILDDKDSSRGSGVSTRRREAKETQALQVRSILDDKDNSRESVGVTTRRREAKESKPSLQGRSIVDDKDNSRSSMGIITRRETERRRRQTLSRDPEKDEEMKLMKEQCYSLVNIALQPIFNKGKIDKTQFKDLARSATHTILSSLGVSGLKHRTDAVSIGTVTCDHEQPTSSSLIPGCCNTCVHRHVKKFVKNLVKEKLDLMQ